MLSPEFQSEEDILKLGGAPVSTRVLDQSDSSVYWKECSTCGKIKPFGQFKTDSSYREGVRNQCQECESSPVLSTEEHLYRQREMNFSAASNQRWGKDQLDFMDDDARRVGYLHHSDFIRKLNNISQYKLYIRDGNFVGDLAIYKVFERIKYEYGMYRAAKLDPDRPTFQYLCYMPLGYSPEFSVIEFDHRAVPLREKERGWRTVLLKLIKSGVVIEADVNKEFGYPVGPGSIAYRRDLFRWRNR